MDGITCMRCICGFDTRMHLENDCHSATIYKLLNAFNLAFLGFFFAMYVIELFLCKINRGNRDGILSDNIVVVVK